MDNANQLKLLPNDAVKNAFLDIIKMKLKSENFKIHVETGSSKGDNYIGVVYRAEAKALDNCCNGDSKNQDEGNTVNAIIKVPPQNEIRREKFFARPCFLREAMSYDEIIPLFLRFQQSKGIIPTQGGFYQVPECFKTLSDDGTEAIFLKDLKAEGFEMFNRFEQVTYDHVKIIVEILGKLHAISFAMQDQCPEKLAKYKELKDILVDRDEDQHLEEFFDVLKQRAVGTLCPDTEQHIIDRINNLYGKGTVIDLLKELVNGKNAEPYAVICHGDCWNNNILFKNKNGKPIDARLIDWQIVRYASPVCDLMYYLFSCTTKSFRDKHYDDIISIYYNSLATLLKRLGTDPCKVFPRHALDEQLKKFGAFGMVMSFMLLPIITSNAEDVPDLDELSEQMNKGELNTKEAFHSKNTEDVCIKRTRDVIIDMVKLNYI